MPDDMRTLKCRECEALFEVPAKGGAYSCPGCGKGYMIRPRGESTGRAAAVPPPASQSGAGTSPGPGSSPAAPKSDTGKFSATGGRRRVRRRKSASFDMRTGWPVLVMGCGALLLVSGLVVLVSGPFDEDTRAALAARKRTAANSITDLNDKHDELRRGMGRTKSHIAATEKKIADLRMKWDLAQARLAVAGKGAGEQVAALRKQAEEARSHEERLARMVAESRKRADTTGIIAAAEKKVLVIRTDRGFGSGFIITGGGLAVTNYHVVRGSTRLSVSMQKRDSRETVKLPGARIIAIHKDADLALIQLPRVPEVVALEGKYPVTELRDESPRNGEDVFAVGSPGLGTKALEYTVTKGIISNPSRKVAGIKLIQTSAAVNPGNSGGPLFDARGRALGVVTLKAVIEAVAFAVPVTEVTGLQGKSKRAPYAVTGTLAEWEKIHNPLSALARKDEKYDPGMAIKLPAKARKIVMSRSGAKIYALLSDSGTIQEFDVGTRKMGRRLNCDVILTDFVIGPAFSNEILACSPSSRKLLRIRLTDMKVVSTVRTAFAPVLLDYVGGFSKWVGVASHGSAGQSVNLIRWTDLGDQAGSKFMRLQGMDARLGFWSDGCTLVALGIAPGGNDLRLQAASVQLVDYLRQIADARKTAVRAGSNAAYYRNRASQLAVSIGKLVKVYEMDGRLMLRDGVFLPVMRFVGRDRLVFAKRMLRLGTKLNRTGEFGLPPGAGTPKGPRSGLGHRLAQAMNNIFSVSPCGNWAASGTHIYSTTTLKPVRKLPFTSTKHCFSRDGRSIYMYDASAASIYCLLDWQKNAPALEKKPAGK